MTQPEILECECGLKIASELMDAIQDKKWAQDIVHGIHREHHKSPGDANPVIWATRIEDPDSGEQFVMASCQCHGGMIGTIPPEEWV